MSALLKKKSPVVRCSFYARIFKTLLHGDSGNTSAVPMLRAHGFISTMKKPAEHTAGFFDDIQPADAGLY
jgi:hypothetical protein